MSQRHLFTRKKREEEDKKPSSNVDEFTCLSVKIKDFLNKKGLAKLLYFVISPLKMLTHLKSA
jgi:hypothetical protein